MNFDAGYLMHSSSQLSILSTTLSFLSYYATSVRLRSTTFFAKRKGEGFVEEEPSFEDYDQVVEGRVAVPFPGIIVRESDNKVLEQRRPPDNNVLQKPTSSRSRRPPDNDVL